MVERIEKRKKKKRERETKERATMVERAVAFVSGVCRLVKETRAPQTQRRNGAESRVRAT